MKKREIIAYSLGVLLAGTTAVGYMKWKAEHQKVEDLQQQLAILKQHEMRSVIDRSVSAQMEDIANEQRKISDEKREEALQRRSLGNPTHIRQATTRWPIC